MLFEIGAGELLRARGQGGLLRRAGDEPGSAGPQLLWVPPVMPAVPERLFRWYRVREQPSNRAMACASDMTRMSATVDWSIFYAQLHAFVAARVRTAPDVDDLVQLILERAMEKAASAGVENVAGWLFGIARNAIADHYRSHARTLLAAADELESVAEPMGRSDEERAQVLACMGPLLDTMGGDEAQLLRWADMEGRSMQSIAGELGISLTAAKSRVQRARKAFVKVTRECCAITKDARGRVTNLTPRPIPKALACAAAAGCSAGTPQAKGKRHDCS